jgi:class I fructose-bisphosphate aldolase
MSWGKQCRLNKLKRNNYYCLLAMDHALTMGPIDGISTIDQIIKNINFAAKFGVPSIVLNGGMVEQVDVFTEPHIVIQTMGLPNIAEPGVSKVPTWSVQTALSIGATAISVQLNLHNSDIQNAIQNIANLVYEANKFQLPVLFMLNHKDWDSSNEFEYAIRICIELGADLVKIALPIKDDIIYNINPISPKGPPVIMAGGDLTSSIIRRIRLARELGFKGICIGRNFFQNKSPDNLILSIDEVFEGDD